MSVDNSNTEISCKYMESVDTYVSRSVRFKSLKHDIIDTNHTEDFPHLEIESQYQ